MRLTRRSACAGIAIREQRRASVLLATTIATVGVSAETLTPAAAKAIIGHDSDPEPAGRTLVAKSIPEPELSERRNQSPGMHPGTRSSPVAGRPAIAQ